jgi:hypothetical protein
MKLRRGGRKLAALSAVAVGAVGCTRYLDMERVASAIQTGLEDQLGLTVTDVDCPESREMKVEDAFECSAATEGGGRIRVSVTQQDAEGNIAWETAGSEGLLDLGALAEQIRLGLSAQAQLEAQVDCGGGYGDAPAGASFECTATHGEGDTARIRVTVRDAEGNVDWTVLTGEEPAG